MTLRRRFRKPLREDPNRKQLFPVVLTHEEHEYLFRKAHEHNINASMLVRQRTFYQGWRRELLELRQEQGNGSINEWDARRRWRKMPNKKNGGGSHEPKMPV